MNDEPTPNDLVDFICSIQPELDADAAARMLMVEHVWEGIAEQWRRHRALAVLLLDLHIDLVRASA